MEDSIKKNIDFLLIAGQCKTQKRTGWINHNVNLPESICDHMYRMAIASLLLNHHPLDNTSSSLSSSTASSSSLTTVSSSSVLPSPEINISRCIMLSLVHDIGESITGDIVPMDPMGKEEKQRREKLAMETIRDTLLPNSAGNEIYNAWLEYCDQKTLEATVVKDLDRCEMILQSLEYEKAQNINLSTFYESVRGKIRHPIIQLWAQEIEKRRSPLIVTKQKPEYSTTTFFGWCQQLLLSDLSFGITIGIAGTISFLYLKQRFI